MAVNEMNQTMAQEDEMVLMLDGIYNELIRNLNRVKDELQSELKYSSMQTQEVKKEISEGLSQQLQAVENIIYELKLGYQQTQAIHSDIADIIDENVTEKLKAIETKLQVLETLEKALAELNAKLVDMDMDAMAETISEKVVAALPALEEIDYDKIGETVAEKTEASVAEHSRQIMDAVAAIPVPENVDYTRIVEEVGDRIIEILQESKAEEPAPVQAAPMASAIDTPVAVEIDYDKIIFETAEKVIESLPAVEKIDYQRLAEMVAAQMPKPEIDYDLLAEKVAAKMPASAPVVAAAAAPMPAMEIDYDAIADKVAERVSNSNTTIAAAAAIDCDEEETSELFIDQDGIQQIATGVCECLDIDMLATKIAEKIQVEAVIDYDRVCQAAQAAQIVPDAIDYDRIADVVVERLDITEVVEVIEEAEEAPAEAPVEEPMEEVVEETVEEPVIVEEAVEEVAATEVVEEPVEEAPAQPVLVEASGDLVVRLKKSFTAKLKQSDDDVKRSYSALKNALLEYKKINSNVSWHGDRFNFGRDTVARINICGKTLGLYLALDPLDPEFKTTVYHQKDVSKQKAYESTPFMVKVKSEAGVKKAIRLVIALAEKLGTTKEEEFTPVDYVEMFPDATDEQLLSEGLIKSTKEKKVTLDF